MNSPGFSSNPAAPNAVSRRQFAVVGAAAAASALLGTHPQKTGAAEHQEESIIDTNVWLGHWPFRRSAFEDTAALVHKLRSGGVIEAWAGNLDSLLHQDVTGVNNRLAEECARQGNGFLKPCGTIHPGLPGWEQELDRCAKVHRMRAIRLHPNYHGYALTDSIAGNLLEKAATLGLLVQIVLIMEDERTIHPLVAVPPVDPAPLPDLLQRIPNLRIQLLNAFRTLSGLPLKSLALQGLTFEIAMLEGVEGIANLLENIPLERLCFGSHAPVFIFESARLKLRESLLTEPQRKALFKANARALIP